MLMTALFRVLQGRVITDNPRLGVLTAQRAQEGSRWKEENTDHFLENEGRETGLKSRTCPSSPWVVSREAK